MARVATAHVCSACGHQSPRWLGQCPGCGAWGTLNEERVERGGGGASRRGGGAARGPGAAGRGAPAGRPTRLGDVTTSRVPRLQTGLAEVDRVLGGGLVPGSLVLLGGSPGIGKSTLLNMVLGRLADAGRRTLYVSGEESASQVRLRAERLAGIPGALDVPILAETDLDTVLSTLEQERPDVCVIDSVQTLHDAELSGAPGSVGQVREVASRLMGVAKRLDIATVLVGHVTKEGALAGPRVLEHLVDCVLQFEGERERTYRTLRAQKNRFGSTNEAGVFEMHGSGLVEVLDPSARFVGEATRAPGSVVLCAMEGSRPLLVEVQALVSPSELVPPRRVCNGIDRNRLALVLAVLGRHAGLSTSTSDVFVNVVGGIRVDEPGADLAVALAVASAARGVVPGLGGPGAPDPQAGATVAPPVACFGEVGLTGELRGVAHGDRRLSEARKFGLDPVVSPERCPTLRDALRTALPRRPQGGGRNGPGRESPVPA
ncbi:DNA repair protein RadA [Patulibacter brassicae]|uniref:DNA repair protein RadA n=1 Tax=Patulibacter brassicae TaxID=1705717 RepID=A0ABU4VMJ7_9ACTN|nr:DNA repair protein RadA [Patulibacter brassicae]MDX8153054.1 DNA repair protein RadA [Patulibacter brassicae]